MRDGSRLCPKDLVGYSFFHQKGVGVRRDSLFLFLQVVDPPCEGVIYKSIKFRTSNELSFYKFKYSVIF